MKNRKFIFILAVTVSMILSACQQTVPEKAGDTQQDSEDATSQAEEGGEILVWKVAAPGGIEEYMDEAISVWQPEVNALLKEKGADYSVRIEVLSYGASVADVLESLRDAGEQADVISLLPAIQEEDLAGYYLAYPECAKRNLLLSLDEMLDTEKGEALHGAIPERDFERAKVDGVTYGLSAVLPSMQAVLYSTEQMKKYGVDAEELDGSIFEQEEILKKIKNLTGEAPYGVATGDVRRKLGLWIAEPTNNVVLNKEGSFVNVTETQEFRDYLAKLADWKEKGLVEILGSSAESREEMIFAQDLTADANYSDEPYQATLTVDRGDGTQTEASVLVAPDETEPVLDPYWGDNKMCIASWTQEQERTEDFLVRLLTDSEFANAIQYGREGKDYTLGGNVLEQDPEVNVVLRFFGCQYTNPLLTYPTKLMIPDKQEYAGRFQETYGTEIPDGFRFDPTPVLEEIAATNKVFGYMGGTETAGKIVALEIEDVDEAITEITRELEEAGIDEVVAEANRQLEEWKKGAGE